MPCSGGDAGAPGDPRAPVRHTGTGARGDARPFPGDPSAFAGDPRPFPRDAGSSGGDAGTFTGDPSAFPGDPGPLTRHASPQRRDTSATTLRNHRVSRKTECIHSVGGLDRVHNVSSWGVRPGKMTY